MSQARNDAFGASVALDGGRAFAGAPCLGTNTGTAYALGETGHVQWVTTGDGILPGDKFGASLSAGDGRLLVGTAASSGSAHLLDATTGAILQSIDNPDPLTDRIFGNSVSLNGNRALVSAAANPASGDGGAVYMFDLLTGTLLWTTGGAFFGGDLFGASVACDGTYVLVGAAANSDDPASYGSVHLLDAMTGEIPESIVSPDLVSGDLFGSSVSLFGNKVLIRAERNLGAGSSRGAVWVYQMDAPTQVPLPATAPLLLGPLALLAFMRRHERKNRRSRCG